MSAQTDFDMIIAGGGATGLALALGVARQTDLRVAVIDANQSQQLNQTPQGDNLSQLDIRSVALSAYSVQFLNALGVELLTDSCPIEHIHVSDKGHLGRCELHARDYQQDALGRVIELSRLTELLFAGLSAQPNPKVTLLSGRSISEVQQSQQQIDLKLDNGRTVSSGFLAVTEGGQSATRDKLGIQTQREEYNQVAIVANVALQSHHDFWAFERFTQTGPLAMLPLRAPGQDGPAVCSLVWTVSNGQQQALLDISDTDFLSRLQATFGYRLGKFSDIGPRSSFPLALARATQAVHHRAALLGNALQSLHPIAGQGLNIGLRDVASLLGLLGQFGPNEIGCFAMLDLYKQARIRDQKGIVAATDSLVRIFSNQYLPMVIGRNLGLTLLQNSSKLKHSLANRAMGFNRQGHTNAKL